MASNQESKSDEMSTFIFVFWDCINRLLSRTAESKKEGHMLKLDKGFTLVGGARRAIDPPPIAVN